MAGRDIETSPPVLDIRRRLTIELPDGRTVSGPVETWIAALLNVQTPEDFERIATFVEQSPVPELATRKTGS